mgnify:FL=1
MYELFLPDDCQNIAVVYYEKDIIADSSMNEDYNISNFWINIDLEPSTQGRIADGNKSDDIIEFRCTENDSKFTDAKYDAVILPSSLDFNIGDQRKFSKNVIKAHILRKCKSGLKRNGMLMITSNNLFESKKIGWYIWNIFRYQRKLMNKNSGSSLYNTNKLVKAAGLREITSFSILPDLENPRTLISINRNLSRFYYDQRRETDTKDSYSMRVAKKNW